MLYFNQDRIPLKYHIKDSIVFEINSNLKLEQILDSLLKEEDISSLCGFQSYFVAENIPSDLGKEFPLAYDTYKVRNEHSYIPDYTCVHDDDYDGEEDEFAPPVGEKPFMEVCESRLFNSFEQFTFGVTDTDLKVTPVTERDVDKEVIIDALIQQIACSIGIMPHLLEYKDTLSIQEMKKLSALGELTFDEGIYNYYSREYPDCLPSKDVLDVVSKLTAPERQLLSCEMNPVKATDICCLLKKENPNVYLTRDLIEQYMYENITETINLSTTHILDSAIRIQVQEKAEELFRQKYHFVPRVIEDYIIAQTNKRPYTNADDLAGDIVDNFNRQSLTKIAGTKSEVLYALCDELNFNEVKASHIDIIAALYPADELKRLHTNHFIEYYKAHSDMPDTCLSEMLESYRQHTDIVFDINKPVDKMLAYIKNIKGAKDCERMQKRYNYCFDDNDLAIKGRNIEVVDGDMKMYMLPATDYRNFTVGYDTHCCQHYNGAGETCVYKLTSDPYAGVVVIERKGKILAQGFVWTDESNNTLVFDNVEFADDRLVQQFEPLFSAWSQAMPYDNIHVGTGYNENMQSWGRKANKLVTMPTTINNEHVYSDYHGNARMIKNKGTVLIPYTNRCRIIENQLVFSKFDRINDLGLGYLLATGLSVSDIVKMAEKIDDNSITDEEIKDLIMKVKNHELLMDKFDTLSDDVQVWFASTYPKEIDLIKNPCEEIAVIQVRNNPMMIKNILNPSEEMQIAVVQSNGLLFSEIKNPTESCAYAAVEQNGYALSLIPESLRTNEVVMKAVSSAPRIILSVKNPSEEAVCEAVRREPQIIGLIQQIAPVSDETQVLAVSIDPSAVLSLRNPSPVAVKAAIERNGMFIRNFQRQYPDLRETAIRQNPMCIGVLDNPTLDECILALSLNPNCESKIRDNELLSEALCAVQTYDSPDIEPEI